jgi:phage major head subunit gpT-like protein
MLTSQFADLIDPAFRKEYWGEYNDYPKVMEQVFNVLSSDRNYEKTTGVSGLGLVPQKKENEDVIYDDSVQLYDKTYTHTTYGLGFKISQEMIEDDLTNAMMRRPQALARSVAQTRETLAAGHFNNAFDGTNYPGPDGKALCSTTVDPHPGYGAATYANSATGAALSHTAVMAARKRMMKVQDHRGLYVQLDPKILLVPVDLEEDAYIITKTERVPGSANWDKNLLDNKGLESIVWRYLTSTTAWFILSPKQQHELTWFDRIKPQFQRDSEFDKDVAKWKTRFRCSSGWNDWRGVDGNAGA